MTMSTDETIAHHVARLKAKAATPAVSEELDAETIRANEQRAREQRRQDTARRLKYPALVQRTADGKLVFKHDLQVRDGVRAEGLKHDPNPTVKR